MRLRHLAILVLLLGLARPVAAQTFPFTSGPIPLCDTSTFTATVSGVGMLITPDGWNWGPYLDNVVLNITTDHPQTLQISLTSPEGTTLLLSAFNGVGGQNYTNTSFPYWGGGNITTAAAPFTGSYNPQGGALSVFDWENADGVWTITVIDTACATTGPGPGGTWNPGWFNGGVGSGAFSFGFSSPPPPCIIDMGSPVTTICPGQTVDVLTDYEVTWGGGGSVMFSVWDQWTGASVADPYNVTTAGTYQIEGSDWSGCWYMGTYTVIVAPAVALGPDQTVDLCSAAGPVDLTALFDFTGATNIIWNLDGFPIATASAASATVPGVYAVAASNAGCNDVAQVVLTVSNGPALGADQTMNVCAGEDPDLTALYPNAGPAATWTLDGAPIAPPTAVTAAGVYEVSATSVDGCVSSAQVTVTVENPPALGPDQAASICNNTSLDLTTFFTTDGMNVAWTFIGAPVTNPAAVQQAGTYRLVATTAAGCTDTALVVVTVFLSPVLGMDLIDSTCEDEPLDLTGFYPTTGLATSWTFGGMPVPDPTAVITPGAYTLVAVDANNCTDTAQTTVELMPLPVLGPDQSITGCDAVAVDLTGLYATGADNTTWTLGGAPVADPTAVTEAGSYTLTVTNASGCIATAVVTLQLDPSPTLGADQTAATCAGTAFDLTPLYATAGLTVEWTLADTPVADPAAVVQAGAYQLVVTNSFNCTDTALVNYTVNTNPDLGGDLNFSLCPWQSVDLGAVFPVDGQDAEYTFNGQPVSDPTSVTEEGLYTVIVTDANACVDTATANVVPIECLCVADFTADARCLQEPVQFTLVADSTVLGARWDFSGNALASTAIDPAVLCFAGQEEMMVTLEATLSCGVITVQRTIRVPDCSDSCSVYVPTAFTPNGDKVNELWAWTSECEPTEFEVIVFNRWGEEVFTSTDPNKPWDGTSKGAMAPDGLYLFRMGYRLPYQDRKQVQGSVVLLR